MNQAEILDLIFVILGLFAPIIFALKIQSFWLSVFWGTFTFWLLFIIAGGCISLLDPARVHTVDDSVWVLFGWIFTFIYSFSIGLLKDFFVRLAKRKKADSEKA